MPKKKTFKEGIRTNVWLPPKQREVAVQIINLSKFVQICLDNAPDIMAWAILRGVEPEKYRPLHTLDEQLDVFNEKYPLDPLTAKRLKKWPKNSPKKPELW